LPFGRNIEGEPSLFDMVQNYLTTEEDKEDEQE